MIRQIVLCLSVGLAACSSPSPRFAAAEARTAVVGPYRFDVYVAGDEAQAIRTNPMAMPRAGDVMAAARQATAGVTGCDVPAGGVSGDAAIVTLRLAC